MMPLLYKMKELCHYEKVILGSQPFCLSLKCRFLQFIFSQSYLCAAINMCNMLILMGIIKELYNQNLDIMMTPAFAMSRFISQEPS